MKRWVTAQNLILMLVIMLVVASQVKGQSTDCYQGQLINEEGENGLTGFWERIAACQREQRTAFKTFQVQQLKARHDTPGAADEPSMAASVQDSLALVALYDYTNGPEWLSSQNWFVEPVANWEGIEVDSGRVVQITLNLNNLTGDLPPEIGQLTELTSLELFGNNITSIPAEVGQLVKLEVLGLSYNTLTSLPSTIGQLSSLIMLDVEVNQITHLPDEIGQLDSLVYLILSNNLLTSLPQTMDQLGALGYLLADNNQLSVFPGSITGIPTLTELSMSGNLITSIPSSIGNLTDLSILFLDGNQITSLPPAVGNLGQLEFLSLTNNHLAALPGEMGALSNLQLLTVDGNQLNTLPGEIGQLDRLTYLNLADNQIEMLPDEMGQMDSLYTLILFMNRLSTVPDMLAQAGNLTELDVSYNRLTHLPEELGNRESLWLSISHNQFEQLPAFLSAGTISALTLYANDNRLTFEDLEPIIGKPDVFEYAPQDSVGENRTLAVNVGDSVSFFVEVRGQNNRYQWFRNQQVVENANGPVLAILLAGPGDAGVYHLEVTNDMVPGLTLISRPITLVVGEDGSAPVCGPIEIRYTSQEVLLAVFTYAVDEESGISRVDFTHLKNVRGLLDTGSGWTGPYAQGDYVIYDPQVTDSVAILGERKSLQHHGAIVVTVTNGAGLKTTCDPVLEQLGSEIPEVFVLEQNYPNPFNPETTIRFQVPETGHVGITIYDLLGRKVTSLVDSEMQPGKYDVLWDGTNQSGLPVAGGVYFYQMTSDHFTATYSMTLSK